jgi:hypothetical protein
LKRAPRGAFFIFRVFDGRLLPGLWRFRTVAGIRCDKGLVNNEVRLQMLGAAC